MSREGILDQLSLKSITIQELVYSQVSVSVYKGYYEQFQAAVKVVSLPANTDHRQLEQECALMAATSHPHLLRLYGCFWVRSAQGYCYVIVTEWCLKDLAKDMSDRRKAQFMWKEDELLAVTTDLVHALAYLQGRGIAHRDIKPENLFLSLDKKVKVGDFGSAKWINEMADLATLRGTPLFLSPKLRAAFVTGQTEVKHNMFKSDVYSLGLTLLAIARLNFPMELASVNVTDDSIEQAIAPLPYSEAFKTILRKMLKIDEDRRWDFLEIYKCLSQTGESVYQPADHLPPAMSEIRVRRVTEEHKRPGSEIHPTGLKLGEQLEGVEQRRIPESIKCLKCGKMVNKWDYNAPCQVVVLYCNPQHHMFCSQDCFREFERTNIHPILCPACHVEIDRDTILFYKQSGSVRACSVRQSGNDSHNVSQFSANTAHSAGSKGILAGWIRLFQCCQSRKCG